jgi:HupE / UreJ protein
VTLSTNDGFAGALTEVGRPQHAIPVVLLFFNVGVEIGQLVFVAAIRNVERVSIRIERIPLGARAS